MGPNSVLASGLETAVIEHTTVLVLRRATGAATSVLVNDYGPPAAFHGNSGVPRNLTSLSTGAADAT
jgi:hypothetical protein